MGIWSRLIATPQRTPLKSRPSLTLYFLLAGAFLLTLVPQVVQFPVWVTVIIIASMALRSFIEVYRLPLPSSTFCGIVAVILFGLIWVQYDTIMGRSAGTAVTAGLLAIKFYEIRAPRDIALIIFSCFFVVMSSLLFSQAVELFTYCLIMMWVLTAVLMRVQAGDRSDDNLLRMLSRSGLIFLQCVPLALLLFFFFPRIEGPIGLTLNDPPIGLTDTVAPGSVSKLARDDTPAMYVSFTPAGTYPLPDSMYWRAIVLYQYRNGVFTSGKISNFPRIPAAGPGTGDKPPHEAEHPGPHIDQIITIYANNQIWLYALDVPINAPTNMAGYANWAHLYTDDTVRLATPNGKLDHLARYFVTSSPSRPEETITDAEYEASRLLPTAKDDGPISPRVKALADRLWTEGGGTTDGYIYAVLRYFHHDGFVYSIDLPPQAPDWLTDFLLNRKTGYCEHFAAAFAVLMRLHEVPTRLVTGYVGGDFNPYDGDYVVRESSAHAWDEVWKPTDPTDRKKRLTGRWTRYDPTAFVSGSDASAVAAGNAAGDSPLRVIQRAPTFADSFLPAWVRSGLHEIQLRRDQMEMTWDNVVLSYDTESQFRLARVLGFGGMNPVVELGLICLLAAATCAIALWRWLAHQPGITPVEFLYAAFCRNMARRGVPRATWEGPLAYTERVAEAFPDDLPALRSVGAIVARTRYGPKPADAQAIERLESALARISAAQAAGVREKR
jgi:transglutaminase-like putative cysteine protease